MQSRSVIYAQNNANLDLYPYPCPDFKPDFNNQVTIGDLHANGLKFIYFLIFQNVLDISPADYKKIVDIYKKSPLSKDDIAEFDRIILAAKVLPVGLVRLLGDTLADRGNNDYFILKIIEKLAINKVPLEIMFSNHDVGFFDGRWREKGACREQWRSADELFKLINDGIVKQSDIDNIIEKYYKPNVKLLSYSIDDSIVPPILTLYSHAPVGLEIIRMLVKQYKLDNCFKLDYLNPTLKELCSVIDKINQEFSFDDEVNNVYDTKKIDGVVPINQPIKRLIWNRPTSKDFFIRLTPEHKQFYLRAVHGHLGPNSNFKVANMVNLDCNSLGKPCGIYSYNTMTKTTEVKEYDFKHRGAYHSLYSQDKSQYSEKIIVESKEHSEQKNVVNIPVVFCERENHPAAKLAIEAAQSKLNAYRETRNARFFSCCGDSKEVIAEKALTCLTGKEVSLSAAELKILNKDKTALKGLIASAIEVAILPNDFVNPLRI